MEEISIVILCGGHSRRMGCDKANLIYKKKTFLELIYEQCSPCKEILLSVGENDNYDPSIGIHIIDDFKHCGPLGGIHKALSIMHGEWLFVTACDMPMMDFAFIIQLFQQKTGESDVIVPLDAEGKRHSIGALYNKRILPILEAELMNGNYRMMNLFEKLNVQYVSVCSFEDERKLCNINQIEDYQRLMKEEIPVVSVINQPFNSQSLIKLLSEKGIRVTYFKQCKDNSILMPTGAIETIVVSEHEMLHHKKRTLDLRSMILQCEDTDLILLEGWEQESCSNCLKLEVKQNDKEKPLYVVSNSNDSDSRIIFIDNDLVALSQWLIQFVKQLDI